MSKQKIHKHQSHLINTLNPKDILLIISSLQCYWYHNFIIVSFRFVLKLFFSLRFVWSLSWFHMSLESSPFLLRTSSISATNVEIVFLNQKKRSSVKGMTSGGFSHETNMFSVGAEVLPSRLKIHKIDYGEMHMWSCSVIRTSRTKRNPGPSSGVISWVDEENHKHQVECQNLELEIHNEELQIQNSDLEIHNEELEIQNRNQKMLLIVSWILFFGIIVYKL
uniref:Uncharacterized protein n=1 Tax=Lactuca sativa TaxID=4236 RepID=A0A9R1V5Q2_LACSA|nr:hypothetical protein LSAT_V11C600314590 [Lactuca sativa]